MHFWFAPESKYHSVIKEIEEDQREESKSARPDSHFEIPAESKIKPKCFSQYRTYRNITKQPILQVEYFGECYFLAAPFELFLLFPLTDNEFLEVRKYPLKSEFLEFKIVEEILMVNTRAELVFINMIDSVHAEKLIDEECIARVEKHEA